MDYSNQFSYTSIGDNIFTSNSSSLYYSAYTPHYTYPHGYLTNFTSYYNNIDPNLNVKVNDSSVSNYEQYLSPVPSYGSEQYVHKVHYPTPPSDSDYPRKSLDNNENASPILNTKSSANTSLDDSTVDQKKLNKRRTRTQFNKYQLDKLEETFQKNHYPDVQMVDRLSDTLGLAIERISVWFQNRRAKYKKIKKPSAKSSTPQTEAIHNPINREEAALLSKYALENQEKLKRMGILGLHINDSNRTLSSDTKQVFNSTLPSRPIVPPSTLPPPSQLVSSTHTSSNNTRRGATSNNTHQNVKRLKQTLARTTIANSLLSSSSQSPMSQTNDSSQILSSSPMKVSTSNVTNQQSINHAQHQHSFTWPSPLLSNLLNKETQPIDISNKDNLTQMSDEYKQIYFLRESILTDNQNGSKQPNSINNNKKTTTNTTTTLNPSLTTLSNLSVKSSTHEDSLKRFNVN